MYIFRKKIKITDSSLLDKRTDIHCHILPNVDDGSKDFENSLELLDYLSYLGFDRVIFTPHIMLQYSENNFTALNSKFREFKNDYINTNKNSLDLKLAAEYMLDSEFINKYREQKLSFKNKYILVETSYYNPPIDLYDLLFQITSEGYIPILAHPERYLYMNMYNYNKIKELCLFQLNLLSLNGYYGKSALEKSKILLKENMYNFVGSDLHHLKYYKDCMNNFKVSKSELDKLSRLYDNNEALW